ncbi:MAG: isoprenylcysteine carboxylmethyltransferase family protein [Methyloligellaceae bacterium]
MSEGSLSEDEAACAEVAFRPPTLFLAGLALASVLELVYPLGPGLAQGSRRPIAIGLVICVAGFALCWQAVRRFADESTYIELDKPTTALVTVGPYRLSRNPIYVGLVLIYFGLAMALTSVWALILLPGLIWLLQKGVILPEEEFLEKKFGEKYRAYKRKVPRWL